VNLQDISSVATRLKSFEINSIEFAAAKFYNWGNCEQVGYQGVEKEIHFYIFNITMRNITML
jgi:hypothetical protein